MQVTELSKLSEKKYRAIINRSAGNDLLILPQVKKIMIDVRENGDQALIEYIEKWTGEKVEGIEVTEGEIRQAYKEADARFIMSLEQIIKNITAVHEAQLPRIKDTIVRPENGISVWRIWRPIEKVGLYIPGGKAIYPSSVLMSAIPAIIAGCREIIMCSPAQDGGKIPAPTLVAADMIGINKIYKIGGAEAIAAMVYGTETIPKVNKIFGAGNAYVTAAKMLVLKTCAIDMPAGPSEVLIIADETANPKFIAADLLADGEHGDDSACVLLTNSMMVAKQTITEIKKQLKKLPTRLRAEKSLQKFGLIAITNSINEAIGFSNKYAPEHLEIMTKKPARILPKITNAGSVFLGSWTAKAAGDYATGANHVLPTGGAAKMYPPLGVDSFGKWMQVQKCTRRGLRSIKSTIENIAEIEQLPAHKNSVSIRF